MSRAATPSCGCSQTIRAVPDPDRGYALAAITGALSFRHAKAGVIRALIAERADEVLFALSYDYVGICPRRSADVAGYPSLTAEGGREAAGSGSLQAPHPTAFGRHPPRSGEG